MAQLEPKPLVGFPGYAIATDGVVWGRRGRPLKPYLRDGYLRIGLYDATGRRVHRTIHTLMLEAFVGPRPEGLHGCHLDDDRLHNVLGNLAWDTKSANERAKVANGRCVNANKAQCPSGHDYDDDNTGRRADGSRRCRKCDRNYQARRRNA